MLSYFAGPDAEFLSRTQPLGCQFSRFDAASQIQRRDSLIARTCLFSQFSSFMNWGKFKHEAPMGTKRAFFW